MAKKEVVRRLFQQRQAISLYLIAAIMVIVMVCSLLMLTILKTNKDINMKKIFFSIVLGSFFFAAISQESVLPAPPQKGVMYVTNANIHVGNGTVINNGTIQIKDGKIEKVGNDISVPAGAKVIDAKGKQVYPGIILPVSNLGLVEVSAVRASTDVREIGDMNP